MGHLLLENGSKRLLESGSKFLLESGLETGTTSIKIEWSYLSQIKAKNPAGFHVYLGTHGTPDYTTPVATVLFSTGIFNSFNTTLTGLTGGTTYSIAVRSYNSFGEEQNNNMIFVVAATAGPPAVSSLTVSLTNQG